MELESHPTAQLPKAKTLARYWFWSIVIGTLLFPVVCANWHSRLDSSPLVQRGITHFISYHMFYAPLTAFVIYAAFRSHPTSSWIRIGGTGCLVLLAYLLAWAAIYDFLAPYERTFYWWNSKTTDRGIMTLAISLATILLLLIARNFLGLRLKRSSETTCNTQGISLSSLFIIQGAIAILFAMLLWCRAQGFVSSMQREFQFWLIFVCSASAAALYSVGFFYAIRPREIWISVCLVFAGFVLSQLASYLFKIELCFHLKVGGRLPTLKDYFTVDSFYFFFIPSLLVYGIVRLMFQMAGLKVVRASRSENGKRKTEN